MNAAARLHPLAQTFHQLAAAGENFSPWLRTEVDAEPGWLSAAALTTHSASITELLARTAAHHPTTDKQAPAALWFGHYAFHVMAVPIACYLAFQRVPNLALDKVWARFDAEGNVVALAWYPHTFAALPSDVDAQHPDCVVLASRDALRDNLREQIIGHLTPIVETLSASSSLGAAGAWALAADYAASVFTWLTGLLLGDEALGVLEARAFSAPASALHRQRGFILIEHCGLRHQLVDRVSCCRYFKVEGGNYCSNCPHQPLEKRIARTQAWMAKEAAQVKVV